MKLKYYMRGLGIGICLTTLILSFSNTKEKLTDKEIMERASKLGMVLEENQDTKLKQVINGKDTAPTIAVSATPVPTIKPSLSPTKEPEPTKSPDQATSDKTKSDISFTVNKGMSSDQVASLLEKKGLIDNSDDFNQYIIKAGKASRIRVGTYTLSSNSTYKEIINAITSK